MLLGNIPVSPVPHSSLVSRYGGYPFPSSFLSRYPVESRKNQFSKEIAKRSIPGTFSGEQPYRHESFTKSASHHEEIAPWIIEAY